MPKNMTCTQNINKYGPFNLLNNFRFCDFDNWGVDCNDCFEIGIKYAKDCNVILDIGAHIGLFCLPCASVINKSGKIYAFEPSIANRNTLKEHVKINYFEGKIIVESFLASNKCKKEKFYESPFVNGMNSMSMARQGMKIREVDSITLDEYCRKKNLLPDLIKIDVEGAEIKVLKGCKRLMKKVKPIFILSVHPRQIKEMEMKLNQIFEIAKNNNYKIKDSENNIVKSLNFKEYLLMP